MRYRLQTKWLIYGLDIAICLVVAVHNVDVAAACRLCEFGPASVPYPAKEIGDVFVFIAPANTTCGTIEGIAKSAEEGTDSCFEFRSVSTRCGCNVPPNACHLCWDHSIPTSKLPASDESSGDIVAACENLSVRIHALEEGDPRCSILQRDSGERCGCPRYPEHTSNNTITINDTADTPMENNSRKPNEGPPSEPPCTLCFDGQQAPYSDKLLDLENNVKVSCAEMDSFANLLQVGTTSCTEVQTLGLFCGCAPLPGACTLCPNGESVPHKDQTLDGTFIGAIPEAFPFFTEIAEAYPFYTLIPGGTLTCAIMEVILNGAALSGIDDVLCWSNQMTSSICGCSPLTYAVVLTWVYRISGSLSFLVSRLVGVSMWLRLWLIFFVFQCSVLIIVRILSKPMRRRFTVYHQLVLGVSFFDLVGSTAYILAGAMNPVESGVYQAMGNQATCKIQGVLVQLGLTSMFYNTCLATYFFLVVNHNWKEHQFKKLQFWVHLVVISGGLALAFASIPWVGPYSRLTGICAHQKPPSVPSDLPLTLLLTVPMSIVLVTITVTTVWICVKVYVREVKANKWRSERRMGMTKAVFWQSFWYVAAFMVSQPILLVQNYRAFSSRREGEAMLIICAVLAPSQGILNSVIYFRRAWIGKRKKPTKIGNSSWHRRWCWKVGGSGSTDKMGTPPVVVESLHSKDEEVVVGGGDVWSDEYGGLESSAVAWTDVVGNNNLPRNDANDDIVSAFEAVAEYWRLNDMSRQSFSSCERSSCDDLGVVISGPTRGRFLRPFPSFRLNPQRLPPADAT